MTSRSPLQNTFSLLCWNVHKEMGEKNFDQTFHKLQQHYRPNLIVLQEAVLDPSTHKQFPHHKYSSAINISMKKKSFGVLTAGQCAFTELLALKTIHRELHMATKKTLLITSHPLENGQHLTLVNLHAINFVPTSIFIKEIDRLLFQLSSIEGPLIVAGDFNTWNTKRLIHMDNFASSIGLKQAKLQDAHHIKHLFSKPLDHLYYRELELVEAYAIDTKKISDHNPIYACFRN
ncbi:endonuclease/exonuclease/phosphatase family protein [bacterium]|nr:endonuclease/exonuclease/phosphatase family protein [bacterium]MBU1957342.1 endonuclease/exonuclease/phosphatase family protein [bacterium]